MAALDRRQCLAKYRPSGACKGIASRRTWRVRQHIPPPPPPPPPQAARHAQIASPREEHAASGNTSNTDSRSIARKAPTHIHGQQEHRASDPASLRANPTQVPMLLEFRIFHHARTRHRPRCRPRGANPTQAPMPAREARTRHRSRCRPERREPRAA